MISLSFWGTFTMLAVLMPNLVYLLLPPKDEVPRIEEKKLFFILEKVGQIGCCVFLMFNIGVFKFGFKSAEATVIWIFSFLFLNIFYDILWIRYLADGRKYEKLYQKLIFPIPMAITPAAIFLLTGIFTLNAMLIIFSCCFAIGHIQISWQRYKKL